MFVNKELKARVDEKLRACIDVAERHYGINIKFPKVVYVKRGTVAGTADYRKWEIDLNPILLNENVDDFIARTVPHELAHLIDYQLHPENFNVAWGQKRSVHGPTWKSIMITLGADPSRCHTYDVSSARTKRKSRYTWTCKCGSTMELGPKRHKKMLNGQAQYYMSGHKRCGGYTFGQSVQKVADAAPTVKKPAGKMSAKQTALVVFERVNGNRKSFIETMVKLGFKKTTASTYHYKIKSKDWG